MATSHALLIELGRVLMYPKFAFGEREVADFLVDICTHAFVVTPTETIDVVRDQADNRVLECAVAARALWVVSGDKDLLDLRSFRGIRIASAGEFDAF